MKFRVAAAAAVAIAAALFGAPSCFSQLVPGIPFHIESDRVRPLAKVDLPKVQSVPDQIDFFLEPRASDVKPGDSYPLVHLRIPKKPHFPPTANSGPIRTYGQTLDMIWPDLAGLGESGGAACLERYRNGPGGFCENLVRVYIDFMWTQTPTYQAKVFDKFERDLAQGFIKSVNEKSKISTLELVAVDGRGDSNVDRTTYYLARESNGERGLLIACLELMPSPACETRFESKSSSNILIKILFVHSLLPNWREIVEAVQAKVGGYIVQTHHLEVKE